MAEISKIKLPSGNVYDIKDETARQMIAGGVSFIVAWNGQSTPVVANIPAGVVVTYNSTNYTGTMSAASASAGSFYLVKSSSTTLDIYDEYVVVGPSGSQTWERLGSTSVDLSNLGALAYKDTVSLSKGSGDVVLGESTTFSTTVTPTTTNIKATASGTAVGANGTANAITALNPITETILPGDISAITANIDTDTVPNVTSAGSASTWAFALGTGNDAETLVISGGNGSAPTLGTAKTVVTGFSGAGVVDSVVIDVNNTGLEMSVVTGFNAPTTSSVLTGVKVTSQPTVVLSTGATAGTGVVSVATGITSASTSAGTNDKVTVAKYSDLSVSTS